jgi:hypothetical protein
MSALLSAIRIFQFVRVKKQKDLAAALGERLVDGHVKDF